MTKFLHLIWMVIAAGGALINFKLIALPMSEMVGAGDYLTATLRTSEVAALVIIFAMYAIIDGVTNLMFVTRARSRWPP